MVAYRPVEENTIEDALEIVAVVDDNRASEADEDADAADKAEIAALIAVGRGSDVTDVGKDDKVMVAFFDAAALEPD